MSEEITRVVGGIEFTISIGKQTIEISAPALGTAECMLWVDTFYLDPKNAGEDHPMTGNVAVYLTDPQGRSGGAIVVGAYKPDGLVVGASEGGVPTDVLLYGTMTQPGFAMEEMDGN